MWQLRGRTAETAVRPPISWFIVEDPYLQKRFHRATPEDVLPDAIDYLNIYFYGLTGLMIYNMGTGILRAVGDSRRPLIFLIISAVINTVLDLLFVIVFPVSGRFPDGSVLAGLRRVSDAKTASFDNIRILS